MGRRVTSSPPRPRTTANQLNFRPLTAEVVSREYRALLAGDVTTDAFRRLASRLNRWIAQSPGEDADLAPML